LGLHRLAAAADGGASGDYSQSGVMKSRTLLKETAFEINERFANSNIIGLNQV